MGLLSVLDHYYNKVEEKYIEFEYQLISWGEIYRPMIGNREHSFSARFIMDESPINLFSVTAPEIEPPQKICATFSTPYIKKEGGLSISLDTEEDKTAKEFAAFLSLVTRRRVFAEKVTRAENYPVENDPEIFHRFHHQEPQYSREIDPDRIKELLKKLHVMDRRISEGFMTSLRLYHSAIEMIYTEPDFSYLFLIMCLETISSIVFRDYGIDDFNDKETEQYLNSNFPNWRTLCNVDKIYSDKKFKEMLLHNKPYLSRRKFRKFVCTYLPDYFWEEEFDDAKPFRFEAIISSGLNGHGKIEIEPKFKKIEENEKISKDKLNQTLTSIYDSRSKFVHEGIKLPPHIVLGLYSKIPGSVVMELLDMSSKLNDTFSVPPLITFERLVSYTLTNFLNLWK